MYPTTMRDQDGPSPERTWKMNYNTQHRFYCGVDLHARTMFTHVLLFQFVLLNAALAPHNEQNSSADR
jgi:hypothetical protein